MNEPFCEHHMSQHHMTLYGISGVRAGFCQELLSDVKVQFKGQASLRETVTQNVPYIIKGPLSSHGVGCLPELAFPLFWATDPPATVH